jgi:acetyl esterase
MNQLPKGVDPKIQSFLRAMKGPQIYELPIDEARLATTAAQVASASKVAANMEDRLIPEGRLGDISIRIVRPIGHNGRLPVIMFFHGGGWVQGDKDSYDRLVREIANSVTAAVVFVNYSRSPEAKYPTAIEEAYAATKYISESGTTWNLDPGRLAVFGDSAGGNIAAVVTLLAKERGGPRIDFQVLFYPVTDCDFDTPSYREFATGYLRTPKAMEWFWDNYLPDKTLRIHPTASPLRASVDQLKGLPPALIVTSEFDLLRDEGEAYAHKLMDAGVEVAAVRYLGTIHNFITLNSLSETVAARSAMALAAFHLQRLFRQKKSSLRTTADIRR